MGNIIKEGITQFKVSEYDEIELIYGKPGELTSQPLYLKPNTKHVHNHVLILHCRCNRVFVELVCAGVRSEREIRRHLKMSFLVNTRVHPLLI